jgi:uncharacterized protein YndB with AHSA1/START domain
MTENTKTLPPLHKSIRVAFPPDAAFRRFTHEIGSWWPLRSHSVSGERAETVVFEPHVDGRIFEKSLDGKECDWGKVLAWEPPRRVVFTWHPGRAPELAQEIEVRFVPDGEGSRLELTHSGWEKFGAKAAGARRAYGLGWGYVLRIWAGREKSFTVLFWDALFFVLLPLQRRMQRRQEALETT